MVQPAARNISVLVVEDEKVIAEVCRRTLEGEYDVTLAPNGHAAMEILASSSFDISLIDIRTPLMSGEELYRWIKDAKPSMLSGIIFTTGDVISNNTEQFLKDTGLPYLPKPFSPKELLTAVEKVTSKL